MIKLLGRGTFGIVRQVRCRRDGQVYAIKSIPLQKKTFTYKVNEQGNLQEVAIMADMEHPNIIRMIASSSSRYSLAAPDSFLTDFLPMPASMDYRNT